MRIIQTVFCALLLLWADNSLAMKEDSVIFESDNVLVTFNPGSKEYKVEANETYEHLKFARPIYRSIQVLDKKNNVFFIDEQGNKQAEFSDYIGVCGTVPHYHLTTKETDSEIEVYENETFYDYEDKIPAEIVATVNASDVDSVVFINGQSEFFFTSNFTVGISKIDPRTILLAKGGKYATLNNPNNYYDDIDFSEYYKYLLTKRDKLWGILGVIEPKYKHIDRFNYYLAKAKKENGKVIYIDMDGNEY